MAYLSTASISMAIALLAIDHVIRSDREKDVVPGEAAYCGRVWFPGKYRDHVYEGHFKKLRDAGLLEYRSDDDADKYYMRVPDAHVVTLPPGSQKRTQEAMSHWWTDKGWGLREVLIDQAKEVLKEKGLDLGFVEKKVRVPSLWAV